MNKRERQHLAVARAAIYGYISWSEAAKQMRVKNPHARICALLRKEYLESQDWE